ncbi:hypothetical protein SmJEL517_g00502 [Synchytrium microbalum]|uniref:Ammonium transporter n=1 Tax=Synchytrium microbalum TaxID=1806994 RepID=A0A507CEC2_9FUNG|nr:uncharacterized protein SmJEL517_g00502 [Synchytrium microbalum]TPX37519.1 hypothetical protein SmJEL517_g00502 [Synchytrium microbalum]
MTYGHMFGWTDEANPSNDNSAGMTNPRQPNWTTDKAPATKSANLLPTRIHTAKNIMNTSDGQLAAIYSGWATPTAIFPTDTGSQGFMIWGAALVFIMTPGLGFYYSGMVRAKNALSLIMICFMANSVVTMQWIAFGFSLTFSEGSGGFIGDFAHAGLSNTGPWAMPLTAPAISSTTFMLYQLMFATITPALIFGSVADRFRILPAMIFIFFWATFVYDFVACWTWNVNGWLHNLGGAGNGSFDFAGGGPVHIASGFGGLAYAMVLGVRYRRGNEEFKPHNLVNVFLGTTLLWFGWVAFNGGSALAASPRASMAASVTTIAASAGSITWPLWDYIWSRKMSGLGFCSGAVAGLVAITPASGYVAPWAAVIIGSSAGVFCNMTCRIKTVFGFDDSLDAWAVHGCGGVLGGILTGFFAQRWIIQLDGSLPLGGWMDQHWIQMAYQIVGCVVIAFWAFFVSYIMLIIINRIPGLHLRPSEEEEILGADLAEMGEVGYELVPSSLEVLDEKATATATV